MGRQPLVQLLGKGETRRLAGPWRAEPWKTLKSGWWAGRGGPWEHNSCHTAGWEPRQLCCDLLLEWGKLLPIQPTSETSVQGMHNSPAGCKEEGAGPGRGTVLGRSHTGPALAGRAHPNPAGPEGCCASKQFELGRQLV